MKLFDFNALYRILFAMQDDPTTHIRKQAHRVRACYFLAKNLYNKVKDMFEQDVEDDSLSAWRRIKDPLIAALGAQMGIPDEVIMIVNRVVEDIIIKLSGDKSMAEQRAIEESKSLEVKEENGNENTEPEQDASGSWWRPWRG